MVLVAEILLKYLIEQQFLQWGYTYKTCLWTQKKVVTINRKLCHCAHPGDSKVRQSPEQGASLSGLMVLLLMLWGQLLRLPLVRGLNCSLLSASHCSGHAELKVSISGQGAGHEKSLQQQDASYTMSAGNPAAVRGTARRNKEFTLKFVQCKKKTQN